MKAKYLFIVLAVASLLCACNRDEESLFDKSAAERAQEALDKANTVLVSPANGWEMLYFANKGSRGYNMILKFDANGRVTATAKNALTTGNAILTDNNSTWQVKLDYGPILSFDTYNDVFHAWADPQNDGDGYLGDYEFLILSATPERVVLKGKKHSAYSILRPMPDMPAADYFSACEGTLAKYFGDGNILTLQQGDSLYYLYDGVSGLFELAGYGQKAAEADPVLYPICPTMDGFMMSFGFNDMQNERLYKLDGDKFVGEEGSVISSGDLDQLFMTYIDVNVGWAADFTNSSGAFVDDSKAFLNKLAELTKDSKAKINTIGITYSDSVFHYAGSYILRIKFSYKTNGKTYAITTDYAVNVSNTLDKGHIVISYDKPANSAATTYSEKIPQLAQLVETIMGSYTLSSENAINPAKALKLTNDKSVIVMSGTSNLK